MTTQKIEILIDSLFNSQGYKQAVNAMQNLQRSTAKVTPQSLGLENMFAPAGASIRNAQGQFTGLKQSAVDAYDQIMGANNMMTDQVVGKHSQMKKSVGQLRRTFSMEFLGVMFFGMALQRAFEGLAKSSVSSFMRITEGMTPAGQAINALKANFELLKFSIGSAIAGVLESLLPIIIPIITAISDWVQQNEKLAAWIIIGAIALGMFLFWVGQLYIGIEALSNALVNTGVRFGLLAVEGAKVTAVSGAFATLLVTIGWIILIVALLWAAWKTNFGNIQEFVTNTLGIILDLFITVFTGIWNIIKTVFGIIVAIFDGDWRKVWELTKKLAIQIIQLFSKLVVQLGAIIINIGVFIANMALDAIAIFSKLITYVIHLFDIGFTKVRVKIENAFKTAINTAIVLINKLVAKLADVEVMGQKPFAWLNKLKQDVVPLTDLNTELDKTRERLENAESTLDSMKDNFNIPSMKADKVKEITDGIDDVSNAWIKHLDLVDEVKAPETTVDDSAVTGIFDSVKNSFASISKESVVAEEASASITEQNLVEAESWMVKNDEAQKYLETLQKINTANSGGSTNNGAELERSLPNFVSVNLN